MNSSWYIFFSRYNSSAWYMFRWCYMKLVHARPCDSTQIFIVFVYNNITPDGENDRNGCSFVCSSLVPKPVFLIRCWILIGWINSISRNQMRICRTQSIRSNNNNNGIIIITNMHIYLNGRNKNQSQMKNRTRKERKIVFIASKTI